MRRLPSEGVSAKGSYWDDAFTKSTPNAAKRIILAIKRLEATTNLADIGAEEVQIHSEIKLWV